MSFTARSLSQDESSPIFRTLTPHPLKSGDVIKRDSIISIPDNPFTFDMAAPDFKAVQDSTILVSGHDSSSDSDDFEPEVGSTCFVSGWGALKEGGNKLPKRLQYVGVPMISSQTCNDAYAAYGGITENMICAGFDQGGKDSCQGDSGGPFICMENGTPVITGVVSWGVGCAQAEFPGVYAKVTNYLSWIKANLEQ